MTEENNCVMNGKNCEDIFNVISSHSSRKCYNDLYSYLITTATEVDEDQPCFVTDLADVLYKVQLWDEQLPNVFPYYAVKANADPVLVRLFVLCGYGFDCSTEGEIELALEAGADPRKIIFANIVKTHKALKYAKSVGVDLMTFDNKEELLKIKKEYPEARLIIRLKAENVYSPYNLSIKFGCKASDAEELLQQAKLLELNVIGVSFHVGGLCVHMETFTSSIDSSRRVFDIAENLGFKFSIMDIGAGFFGSTEREEIFHKTAGELKSSLKENFPQGDTKFIAEPGCYHVASAVSLITRIIGKKTFNENNLSGCDRQYYLNDGYYGSFKKSLKLYDVKPIPLLTASEMNQRQKHTSKIWGQTCCSEDLVQDEVLIPDMEIGEFIVWENMGAYRRGLNSTFTGVPFPTCRHVFIQDSRLNMDKLRKIPIQQKVIDYIAKVADLVERT